MKREGLMKMIGKKSCQGAVFRGQGAVFSGQWLWMIASRFGAE